MTELALPAKRQKMDADDWKPGPYTISQACSDNVGIFLLASQGSGVMPRMSKEVARKFRRCMKRTATPAAGVAKINIHKYIYIYILNTFSPTGQPARR